MSKSGKYIFACCSSVSAYHKAKRGGNKAIVAGCEIHDYSNDYLLHQTITKKTYNKTQINKIMAKQNILSTGLGRSILAGVRSSVFNSFRASLLDSLVSSSSEGCGVGRVSYAALIAAWMRDTHKCTYRLNNNEGRKLYTADPNDSRVRRVGVEGHWSFFVCPKADELAGGDSDSIAVLVRCWLSSWLSWYDSVVCYGHYTGVAGVYSTGSALDGVLGRYVALWSHRGRGGRAALPDSVKAEKKAEKAVGAIDDDTALLILAKKLGLSVAALKALQAGKTDEKKD